MSGRYRTIVADPPWHYPRGHPALEPASLPHAPEYDGPWPISERRCYECGGDAPHRHIFWLPDKLRYVCSSCAANGLGA